MRPERGNAEPLKTAPIDYPLRFSGPVTALTTRRVRHGVEPDVMPARPFDRYKDALGPAAFPTTLSLTPPSRPRALLTPLRRPTRACRGLHPAPSSTYSKRPPLPQNRYDAAGGNNAAG
jgi:hypothetical protein